MSDRDDAIIGSVHWPNGGPKATLRVDGTWSVPGKEWMESGLKLGLSDAYEGPACGPFGPSILAELAEMVGGTAHLVPRHGPGHDADVRY